MRTLPTLLAATAALALATAGTAQMAPAAKPTMAAKTTAKTTTKTTTTTKAKPAAKPAATGRMVTTKTSTGKSITYNCSLAGNKTKAACK